MVRAPVSYWLLALGEQQVTVVTLYRVPKTDRSVTCPIWLLAES
jgi:hypothetical protein